MGAPQTFMAASVAELLADVQHLAGEVHALELKLPEITADIKGSAEAVKAAAKTTLDDFQAMGHALMNVMTKEVSAQRTASLKANDQAANTTKGALGQFTKYFWLLIALVGVNTVLLVALLVMTASSR
ncbi:hypothetical protein ACSFA0_24810 [Variovorax sp. LT1P1]|uniref:hypothetical protein n=1 Tax=Variovorax sp. LT1P1 TaxID=3443730 RepID=UPI003F477514